MDIKIAKGSKIKIYTWAELNRKSDSLSVPTALIWLYGWLHLDEFLLDGDEIGLLMVIERNGSCKGTAFDLLNILQLTSPSCYLGDSVDCFLHFNLEVFGDFSNWKEMEPMLCIWQACRESWRESSPNRSNRHII
ncbi:uncharacterized protein LOC102608480 isoform X2 [Citrus sinensis]|nr:uncharacterized protein LOC102608480 isoform X2 [Citrus sinensis]XP_052290763.1 uncharacterized protein LOC102608480 isoform X2 [Citrus sinensis]XP_052290764.1 uncharacterized protein LOC102608480 isoform X2 [Citrus sinensis]